MASRQFSASFFFQLQFWETLMLDRRTFLTVCSRFGLTATLLPGVLWAMADEKGKVTREMIDNAAAIADVHVADEYKDMMLEDLNSYTEGFEAIYALHIKNDVAPAVIFDPVLPGMKFETEQRPIKISAAPAVLGAAPKNLEDVAFFSVRQLAELVRTKKVSSAALTEMYIARLKRIVRRVGIGNCCGLRGFRHWIGDAWIDFLSINPLRNNRLASDIWICSAHRRDGPFLDHGQTWPALPRCGRYGHRAERNTR